METELADSTMANTFLTAESIAAIDQGEMRSSLTPLDLNANLIGSIMSSFSAQQGLPGPVSNILGEMGVNVAEAASIEDTDT